MTPVIKKISMQIFTYDMEDIGSYKSGLKFEYSPGDTTTRELVAIKIFTDSGLTGEYVSLYSPTYIVEQAKLFANYLIGEDALRRERHWCEIKRALRQYDRMAMGPIDIALWDIAGKYYGAPIHELLGNYRTRLPAYASSFPGDNNGGLDSPEAYANFAEKCLDKGFPGFKLHTWGGEDKARNIEREIETVHAVGNRVGDRMDLMLDPSCEYETFADAITVGRACDEQNFLWYEDPYSDGGLSQHGHRKLSERLTTPLLQTEHIRGLEPHTDFVANNATEFLRADPEYDAGITGAMKIARVAEGFGVDVEYHAPGPAQRHCMAATRNSNYYELGLLHPMCEINKPQIYKSGYEDGIDVIDHDGTVPVPNNNGLGVEYDWGLIDDNTIRKKVYS
ncbi:mandelate racemase [Halobacteria archaeon AArc-curdl1]|uniref:Mandelate racemase n=1 Tax=Natronosalvus hydrolyticus TaxID=2979988 RepID=A0AAP3E6V7_9EURY|nr:mandelate racemase [Halobacteria archaeon AArc-curdl1]